MDRINLLNFDYYRCLFTFFAVLTSDALRGISPEYCVTGVIIEVCVCGPIETVTMSANLEGTQLYSHRVAISRVIRRSMKTESSEHNHLNI